MKVHHIQRKSDLVYVLWLAPTVLHLNFTDQATTAVTWAQLATLYLLEVVLQVEGGDSPGGGGGGSIGAFWNLSLASSMHKKTEKEVMCILLILKSILVKENGCPFQSTGHLILVGVQYQGPNETFMSMFNVT